MSLQPSPKLLRGAVVDVVFVVVELCVCVVWLVVFVVDGHGRQGALVATPGGVTANCALYQCGDCVCGS